MIPRGGERGLRRAVAVSLLLHLAAAAVPSSWWTRVEWRGGGAPGESVRPAGAIDLVRVEPAALPPRPDRAAPAPRPEPPPNEPTSSEPPPPEPAPDAVPVEVPREAPPPDPAPLPPPAFPAAGEVAEAPPRPVGTGAPPGSDAPSAGPAETGEGPAAGEEAGCYRPPRMLVGELPLSAEEARALDAPPEIRVRLRIAADGSVDRVEIADPEISAVLEEAVVRSARAMRFVPARLGERPVEAWFPMTFVFRR